MATTTEEGAVYQRWFADSLRFDSIGSSADEKRGLADIVGNYAADFETRASQDKTALSVTWDLFGDDFFQNAIPAQVITADSEEGLDFGLGDIDESNEAEKSLRPGEVGGLRIKVEPMEDLPSQSERIAYREAWRKLSSDAARSVEFLDQIGVSLPNGRNSTDEGRLLLWAYLVQRQRSDPIWFGTNQIPSPFEVKSGDFGVFSLIARALRHLERRLRADSLTATSQPKLSENQADLEPTIISLGNNCYRIGNSRVYSVSASENDVLQAFLKIPAMEEMQLANKSGCSRPRDILHDLETKYEGRFAPAIDRPGIKGRGGTFVRIRAEEAPTA